MLDPIPRGNLQWWGYCARSKGCKTACDADRAHSRIVSPYFKPNIYQRGETITVKWLRHNHPGGFVRLAMVPFEESDSHNAFDENAVKYACFESNCKEEKHDDILGPLNGPGFGGCSTALKIPSHLEGNVTLQWQWFGGGVYYADQKAAFGHYVSCSDFVVTGGTPKTELKSSVSFQGGDAGNPGLPQCRYWGSNNPTKCPLGAEDGSKEGCGHAGFKNGVPELFDDSTSPVTSIEQPLEETDSNNSTESETNNEPIETEENSPSGEIPSNISESATVMVKDANKRIQNYFNTTSQSLSRRPGLKRQYHKKILRTNHRAQHLRKSKSGLRKFKKIY